MNQIRLRQQIQAIYSFRWLLVQLVRVELKLRYRKSFFGVLWTLMNPILNASILYFVFRAIFKIKSLGNVDFFPYVYSGVLLVNFFTQSIIQASQQLSINTQILRRINIPGEIFIFSSIIASVINLLFGFVPMLLYFVLTLHLVSLKVLLVPLFLVSLTIIATSTALFLSIAYIYFQDLRFLIPVIMTMLFYLTPVFYDLSAVGGKTRQVMNLNPLVAYLESTRSALSISGSIRWSSLSLLTLLGMGFLLLALRFLDTNRKKAIFLS